MLLFMFALPIILNIDFILDFWLESVPDYTNVFVILSFCDALVGNLFGVPLMTALSATGKIRNYQIVVSSIILMYIPICYFVLRTGFYAPSVLYVSIGISFFSGVIRFLYCRRQIGFSLKKILKLNIYPLLLMVLLVVPLSYYLRVYVYNEQTWFDFILLSVITILEITIISWFVCIRKGERIFIISMLKSILHRK